MAEVMSTPFAPGTTHTGLTKPEVKPEPVKVVEAPTKYIIVIDGRPGTFLTGAINGVLFKLPQGVEIEVSADMYNAISGVSHTRRD